eukprot:Polyplicarium_translucidae@DN3385_c1_g1_i11.p1
MMSSPRDLAPMKRVASGGDESTEGRDRWPSRTSFIFAAIGSAVGIGNLWRFPYQSFKFGGGAFFVPYLLALFFIGIPMLQLEFALGQTYQGGHLKTFDKVGKRFRGLGLAAPFFAFVVTTYYSAILGWSLIYFVNSFSGSLPWAVSAGEAKLCASVVDEITCAARNACTWIVDDEICTGAVLKKATSFFVESINLESDPKASLSLAGSGYVVAGLFCTWLVTFVAIAKGAKFLGYVVYFTMGVPLLLLAIITARGASLPGAGDGIRHYIGIWDMGQLSEQPEMWTAAVGQILPRCDDSLRFVQLAEAERRPARIHRLDQQFGRLDCCGFRGVFHSGTSSARVRARHLGASISRCRPRLLDISDGSRSAANTSCADLQRSVLSDVLPSRNRQCFLTRRSFDNGVL